MTDELRYLFAIHGYCHLQGAISGPELAACQQAAVEYINTPTEDVPAGFSQTPAGKFVHAHAWDPCLESLAMHPGVFPTILELTDGKPKMLDQSGMLFYEDESRDVVEKDSYDPARDITVSVAGTDGVHLHCGREGLFASDLQFSAHNCGYFEQLHGRLHCGNFAVFVYLSDVAEGDGGLLVLEGSHKASFERPGDLGCFAPFGGGNPVPTSDINGPPWDHRTGVRLKNVVPVKAGDVLIMPEALTHGVMPWAMRPGSKRLMLIFRFEHQHTASLPTWMPPEIEARLSDETKELAAFAHVLHTKQVAIGWCKNFLESQPRL